MRLSPGGVRWLTAAAVALAVMLVLIVMRGPIAQAAAKQVLAWRGIDADLTVVVLDFDRAVVEGVRLGPEAAPGVAARRIEARYTPWGVVRGHVRAVTVEGLEAHSIVDAAGVRLNGVPAGNGGGAGGEGAGKNPWVPTVSVPDGRLYVDTPAGEVVADVVVKGDAQAGWSAQVSAYPAVLAHEGALLELAEGGLDVAIADNTLHVAGDVRLATAASAGAQADDVAVELRFDGQYTDMTRLAGLAGEGVARVNLPHAEVERTAAAAWAERVAPRLAGASGEALGAHLESLRRALTDALGEVSAQAEFTLAVGDGRLAATPSGDTRVTGRGGASMTITSASDVGGAVVYDAREGAFHVRDISAILEFPQALSARAIVSTATLRREGRGWSGEVSAPVTLAPWSAGGLTLAGDAQSARLVFEPGTWRLETVADLTADGARWGVEADDLVAHVALAVNHDQAGLHVAPAGEALQHVAATRVVVAGRAFDAVDLEVTSLASDGAILTLENGGGQLETRLLETSAGLEALGARWAAQLPAAELAVTFEPDEPREVRLYVQAPRFEGVRRRAEDEPPETATIQASVVDAAIRLDGERRAHLRFDGLSASGSALPARVARAAGEFDVTLDEAWTPREGQIALAGAEIEDAAERARFTPLTLGGAGTIADGSLDGSFTAVDADMRTIVEVGLAHAFATGAGTLTVATPQLTFAPRGLQPSDVSPLLLGPIVNVGGGAQIETQITWDPAGVEAGATVALDSLGFGTRFGRVEGLTTRFEIADLIGLRTAEPQTIRVGLLDPGVPLRDGEINVELLGGTRARLLRARFPFAGGEITADPAEIDWSQPEQDVLLRVRAISLDELDSELNPPGLDFTGSLSGVVPIEARDHSVFVVGGELVSNAPGRISYTGRAGEGVASQNESTKLAFDALKNFHYDRLVLTLNGNVAGNFDATVHLEGRNPDLLEGYPINFNLNTSAEFANLLTQAFQGMSLSAARTGLAGEEGEAESTPEGDGESEPN